MSPGGAGAEQGGEGCWASGSFHWKGLVLLLILLLLLNLVVLLPLTDLQVLEQADIIDHVHSEAITSTENTKVACRGVIRVITCLRLVTRPSDRPFRTRPAIGFISSSSCSSSPSGDFGFFKFGLCFHWWFYFQSSVPGLVQWVSPPLNKKIVMIQFCDFRVDVLNIF